MLSWSHWWVLDGLGLASWPCVLRFKVAFCVLRFVRFAFCAFCVLCVLRSSVLRFDCVLKCVLKTRVLSCVLRFAFIVQYAFCVLRFAF